MSYSLWPHQAKVEPLLTSGSAILWHEMRTGKTRSALHAFNQLYNAGTAMDLVVVTVASAKTTWRQEVEEMDLGIPVITCFGEKTPVMKANRPGLETFPRIFVLNWEILPHWQRLLHDTTYKRQRPFVLVLDESHLNCRNPNNKRWKAAFWLSRFAYATWLLTGTLQVKSGLDIFHQVKLLGSKHNPFKWMDEEDFGNAHCNRVFNRFKGGTKGKGGWDYIELKNPESVLERLPAVSVLRIQDVAPEVPLPTHIPIWIGDLEQRWDFYRNDQTIAEEIEALVPMKARMTTEFIMQMEQRPVAAFGWNVAFTEKIAELLEAPLIRGGTSLDEREQLRQEFQAGRLPVLVGNLRSLGLGISLSRADHFVYGQPYWDASLYLQVGARGTDLRKRRSTTHYHLLVAGSIDEYVWKRRLDRGRAIERLYEAAEQRDLVEEGQA